MEFFVDIRQREIFLPVVRVHANICVQISPDETLHVVRRGIVGRTNRSSRYPRNLVTRISKRSPKSCKKIDRLLFFQLGNGIEEKFAKILNYSFSEWMNEWMNLRRKNGKEEDFELNLQKVEIIKELKKVQVLFLPNLIGISPKISYCISFLSIVTSVHFFFFFGN